MDKRIQYFDRYSGKLQEEAIYGESWLRWTYGTVLGRFFLFAVVKRALFSSWYGWRMNGAASRRKIVPFCRQFGVDTSEFEFPIEEYRTFNDFFIRRLKQETRPIAVVERSVVFPADGRHLGFQNTDELDGVYAKGQHFDLATLIGDSETAQRYLGGTLVISRLSPVDCHRFSFPVAGLPGDPRSVNGYLRSVNPLVLRKNIRILFENRRFCTEVKTEQTGRVLIIEIGATCVGSIRQRYTPGATVAKGAEKGYFEFGGSASITLFEPGEIKLSEDLVQHSESGIELYAHMGDVMGTVVI